MYAVLELVEFELNISDTVEVTHRKTAAKKNFDTLYFRNDALIKIVQRFTR